MSRPELILKPKSGLQAIPFRDLYEFRDLFWTLAMRDVQLRYRQTALGAIWVILQPLLGAGLFTFVFGSVAGLKSGDERIPYFLFSFASLLCWNAFLNTFTRSSDAMVANAGLISKIYFPRMILAISGVVGVMIDFLVALALLVVGMVLSHVSIPPQFLLIMLPITLAVLLALGLGLCAAALMVSYRDVKYVIPLVTQILLFLGPITYPVSKVPQSLRGVYVLNPIVGIVDFFRWTTLGMPVSQQWTVAYASIMSSVIFISGALVFSNLERRFADVV